MKTFLTITLCVLLTSIALGARDANTILGFWVGNSSESLRIVDTVAFFDFSTDWNVFNYVLREDSLELFTPRLIRGGSLAQSLSDTMSEDNLQPADTIGVCFIIEHQNPDSLVLRPYRNSTWKQYRHAVEDGYLFDSTRTITLYSILKDTLFSFDRLLFCEHNRLQGTGGTIGSGNTGGIYLPQGKLIERDLRIIIDSTKTMYLYGNKFALQLWGLYKYGNKNALKQGYYQGCLSDSLYRRFIDLLKTSSLDRMRFKKDPYDSTGPKYSLDIYYNGKYKRTEGTDFPLIGYGLVTFFSAIKPLVTEVPLVKSKTAKKMFEQFYKTRDK
ncbi:MAG: hypothetical protein RDU76_04670 [Candidatus Edwardsbacteria bacterium]|nr:hypothetical protein [Candidatus Edwardsbacteria bacterium]